MIIKHHHHWSLMSYIWGQLSEFTFYSTVFDAMFSVAPQTIKSFHTASFKVFFWPPYSVGYWTCNLSIHLLLVVYMSNYLKLYTLIFSSGEATHKYTANYNFWHFLLTPQTHLSMCSHPHVVSLQSSCDWSGTQWLHQTLIVGFTLPPC